MTKNKSKNRTKGKKPRKNVAKKKASRSSFGAISSITTAPVAIGNSIRGTGSTVKPIPGGVRVTGRDFMFPAVGSGSITTWCTVGGTPIAPAAFTDSVIRQYLQMYQKFKIVAVAVHYITSSSTSATGDIMFYYSKERDQVYLNQTSNQLLPYVMSDKSAVIGPQWTNHSTVLEVRGQWKNCDYGMTAAMNEYAEGEIFLLSKTSTTDSPGYVIFDYIIDFAEMCISPRLNSFPLPRIQYSQLALQLGSTNVTAGTTRINWALGTTNLSGTQSVIPTGCVVGDIYKVILDVTNSNSGSWTNVAPNNLFVDLIGSRGAAFAASLPLVDGTTLYTVYDGGNFEFYTNVDQAYSGTPAIRAGVSAVITVPSLQCWMSYVGTVGTVQTNPNF